MARYITKAINGRGNDQFIGGRGGAVGRAELCGWDIGVKVVPDDTKGEPDRIQVYMTGGSHASSPQRLLGEVRDTSDGPVFFPVDALLGLDNAPTWVGYDIPGDE